MSIRKRAIEVLRTNDLGRVTLPSSHLYPHQWAWDSAFAAIGWGHIDLDRALSELEALFEGQWDDGRVPHIHFQKDISDYFPGPEMWGHTTSSISNPPMWVIALAELARRGAAPDRVNALLEPCERSLDFLAEQRDPLRTGAVAIVHPWESGRDNCPAWDQPMSAIDPARAPAFERVDIKKVGDPSQRPTDEEYKRYLVLVRSMAETGFGPGEFAVYDPMMTAMTLWAEEALASLRGREPGKRAARLRTGLAWLWSEESGRYAFHDAVADRRYSPNVLAAYLPLIVETDTERRAALVAEVQRSFQQPFGFATVPPGSELYDSRRYWRGPTWINMNWLFARDSRLAKHARLASQAALEKSGFQEYFEPETGEGLGAGCFTWSAALWLDFLADSGAASPS